MCSVNTHQGPRGILALDLQLWEGNERGKFHEIIPQVTNDGQKRLSLFMRQRHGGFCTGAGDVRDEDDDDRVRGSQVVFWDISSWKQSLPFWHAYVPKGSSLDISILPCRIR